MPHLMSSPPTIQDSVFHAALKEYKDDSNTKTDGTSIPEQSFFLRQIMYFFFWFLWSIHD